MRTVRIFVSSPGDVQDERQRARAVIHRVGRHFSKEARLVPVLWEDAPLRATGSFQEGIDEQVKFAEIDLVVFILWSRLGTPLGGTYSKDGRAPTGTEWEFEQALAAHRQRKSPDLLVYRRTSEPALPSIQKDPKRFEEATGQWKAVEGFFQRWFRGADGSFTAAFRTYGTPDGFEQNFERHLRALVAQRLARGDDGGPAWTGAPFRGLLAFDVEHEPIFFGRAKATFEALQVLREQAARGQAFLLILGASGAGKSSLARAGLLAKLARPSDVEPDAPAGFVVRAVFRPGDGATPFESLVAGLTEPKAFGAGPGSPGGAGGRTDLVRAFQESPSAAVAFVKDRLVARAAEVQTRDRLDTLPVGRLALLVDQLEELFTGVTAPDDRRALAGVLVALARSGAVWVIATLRNDFYGRLAEVPELLALKGDQGQYDLMPPDAAEIAEMVRLPVERAGLAYERREPSGEALDDSLIVAASRAPDALPLLQFALESLYAARDGQTLTWRAYDAMGGLEGALTRRAETTFLALDREARDALPRLVRSLVEVSAKDDGAVARRKPLRADLERDPAVARLVDALLEARLLESDKDLGGRAVVRVAHEALLSAWGRFAGSVAADRELLQIRRRVQGQAAYWDSLKRDAAALLAEGIPLRDGEWLLEAGLLDVDAETVAFVHASTAAARERAAAAAAALRRRKRLKIALVAGSVLAVGGTWGGLGWARSARLSGHLDAARGHLAAARLDAATDALAAAKAERADAPEVTVLETEVRDARAMADLRRREEEARTKAAEARTLAKDKDAKVRRVRGEVDTLSAEVEKERATVFGAHSPLEARAAFSQKEGLLESLRATLDRTVGEAREALEAAARYEAPFGGTSTETKVAFGAHFMERWRAAMAADDELGANLAREQVERVAKEQNAAELEGLGTLTVDVDPPDAEVYLFRYESYETIRTDPPVIPRLVPVPTAGIGRVRPGEWVPDFYPGDPCLVVTKAPEKGSPADGVLEPGDLVIRLNGLPCGDGLFVTEVTPDGPAAKAGVRPFDRIDSIDGSRVEVRQDWTEVEPADKPGGPPYKVQLKRGARWIELEGPHDQSPKDALGMPLGAEVVPLLQKTPAPEGGYRLTCLHRGALVTVDVPAGRTSGLTLDRTAYPLILGPDRPHRVKAGAAFDCAPGSYLLYVRAPGREDQRYPVVVPRGKAEPAKARVRLLAAGESPEGFLFIPPGVFVYGGDPEAIQSAPRQAIDMAQDPELKGGFWIARQEITFGEWLEFLNDPETRADLKPGSTDLLPRYSSDVFVKKEGDGLYAQKLDEPVTAVLGISWNDLKGPRGYIAWKNRKAERDGSRWRCDLPSEAEWERAARGADGRALPWGRRFDFALCVSGKRKAYQAHVLDPAAEPLDESPFGVRDLGGGRWEWCRNLFAPGSTLRTMRGGAWGRSSPTVFRSAARYDTVPWLADSLAGGRLVVRPRP